MLFNVKILILQLPNFPQLVNAFLFLSACFPAVNKISPIDFFMESCLNSYLKRDGTNLLILFSVKVKNKIPSKLQKAML